MSLSPVDYSYMAQAIKLADKARFTTSPNPKVGCVIVKDDVVVGEGYHIQAGGPHAEVHALRAAGEQAKGATAYVTLEPCSHFGRTPPCAQGLIDAGVAKVVVGMTDPNPRVSGNGIKRLEEAGIEVVCNCLTEQCEQLNRGFIKRMTVKKPYVRLKLAASIDGRTAMSSGESQWITGPDSRADVQVYRAKSCAIITGSGTVLADEPALVVRETQLKQPYPLSDTVTQVRQPLRVVIDNEHQVEKNNAFFSHKQSDILMVSNQHRSDFADLEHVTCLQLKGKERHVDLNALLAELAEKEINEVWLEAGARLAGAFIEQDLVDELIIYQAPMLLSEDSRGLIDIPFLSKLSQAKRWQYRDIRQVGDDIRLSLVPA